MAWDGLHSRTALSGDFGEVEKGETAVQVLAQNLEVWTVVLMQL